MDARETEDEVNVVTNEKKKNGTTDWKDEWSLLERAYQEA